MSDGFSIKVRLTDTVTPDIVKKLKAAKNLRPTLEAGGLQLISITKRAFNDPSLRVETWWPKKVPGADGHLVSGPPSNLKLHGILSKSISIKALTNRSVTVGSDRPYAAIHQLGGTITPKNAPSLKFQIGGKWFSMKKVTIPARPYFPFIGKTMADWARVKVGKAMVRAFDAQIGH